MRTIAGTAYTELSTRVAAEMDRFLRGLPTEDGNLLVERMHDACFPAGKLVRPMLFAASAGVCGRDPGDLLSVAIGLEIGHAASLVHDDIIDRDELRRGRTSAWHQHGLESAILTGDALLFALYRTVTEVAADPAVTVEAVKVISEVGHELCLGQVAEADATRGGDLSWPTYQRVIALKSASHIRGCLELGAVFAAAPAERRARLRAFGEHLGMAFQMQDDVLAYVGTVDTAGKDPLSDLRACRASLPVVIACERGSDAERALLARWFSTRTVTAAEQDELVALLGSEPVLKQARMLAGEQLDLARAALAGFEESVYLAVLEDITAALEDRQG